MKKFIVHVSMLAPLSGGFVIEAETAEDAEKKFYEDIKPKMPDVYKEVVVTGVTEGDDEDTVVAEQVH